MSFCPWPYPPLPTPFLLFPGVWSSLGLALIGVTWGAGPKARGAARKTQGAGRSAVHVGDKAEERIPLVPHDEAYEAGFEDVQRRVPDVARIERTVGWKPSRSLEETLWDIIKSYALPCGSHG